MTVPAISPTAVNGTSRSDAKSKTMVDYESFLKLLVAEMKNQDPTKPMDSTDFIAQLATFSQVEQSVQSNTKLDQILQASALIGREVTSADGKTTGVVTEVKVKSDGMVAVLEGGGEITIGEGIVIKAAN